jgi:purine-binding chemotaxis protein CheW
MIRISIEDSNNTTLQASLRTSSEELKSYLCFFLAGQQYAIDLLHIREVRPIPTLTRVVHSPEYILGVANLRGEIVPVVDLKNRFNLRNQADTVASVDTSVVASTLLIVTEIDAKRIAIAVDEIREVFQIYRSEIKAIPRTTLALDLKYLAGMVQAKDGMVLLLDVAHVLSHEELHSEFFDQTDALA